MRRTRHGLVGLLAATVLLVGCSDGGDEPAGSAQPATGSSESAGGDKESDEGGSSSGEGSGAGVEQVDVGKVLVEQTVPLPENPEDSLTLAVLSLEVEGKVMVLRLAVTPEFASASDSEGISLFKALGDTSFRPLLVDAENLKEYSVIRQVGGGYWQSNDVEVESVNGRPMLAYAYFAAPEDDIDSIDLRLSDNFPAFTDIPITR